MSKTKEIKVQILDIDFDWDQYKSIPPDFEFRNDLVGEIFSVQDFRDSEPDIDFDWMIQEQVQEEIDTCWSIDLFEYKVLSNG